MPKVLRTKDSPIAIVGMASIFADSRTLDKYWDNIMAKVDAIIDVPADRWAIDDYYDPDPFAEDKTYCKRGGFIPEVDFNPMEYGLPPNILEVTDTAQLIALVVAKEVLLDAGVLNNPEISRERIGVTLGVGGGQKLVGPLAARLQGPVLHRVLESSGVSEEDRNIIVDKFKKAHVGWQENSFPGLLGNVISGRIANRFDLGGMNCVVDAACAGSLAAMKMAVKELQDGSSDMMITGGVDCDNSPFMFMSFSKTPAFSPTGKIQPFDHESKGMLVGEGLGMVAMKRLADAERDGDKIYAVIKGMGSSSDGKYKSIYAPRSSGQAKALNRAYDDAGFDPKTVGLIEAHGTGTTAGDVAEFAGLKMVFSEDNARKNHIALGSVKSQIGHTKSAAGAAGFIKVALALHHKVLPPTINISKPNPDLGIEDSPFYLNSETRPWIQDGDTPRRAGVSAFGFGGTNFHFVLEEYKTQADGAYRIQNTAQSLLLSAPDKAQLRNLCQSHLDALQGDKPGVAFQKLTAQHKITSLPQQQPRLAFTANDAEHAKELLQKSLEGLAKDDQQWSTPSGVHFRSSAVAQAKVAGLFAGQGSQYVNMGNEIAANFPPLLNLVSAMDKLFKDEQPSLAQVLYPTPVFSAEEQKKQAELLQLTQYAQPAIGLLSLGLYKIFQNAGLRLDAVAGHSFGELTAYCAAGVISESDYLQLAKARGQAMAAPADPSFDAGTMVAVIGDAESIDTAIADVEGAQIANYNSGSQVVVAGSTQAVAKAKEVLKAAKFRVIDLPVSAAFHTPLVAHAQQPFAQAIEKVAFNAPTIPVYSNASGEQHSSDPQQLQQQLKDHVLNSVQFKKEIESMYAQGVRVFIEFGPKNTLSKLTSEILKGQLHECVSLNANPKKDSDWQMRDAASQLAVLGVLTQDIDVYQIAREDLSQRPDLNKLNVKLTAANFVSDKTRQSFVDALNDDHTIASQAPSAESKQNVQSIKPNLVAASAEQEAAPQATPEAVEQDLEQNQLRASSANSQPGMSAIATTVVAAPVVAAAVQAASNTSIASAPSAQASMADIQEQQTSNNNQGQVVDLNNKTANQTNTNDAGPALSAEKIAELTPLMLDVVADKTGYPSDMLEMSMDMEADLGIDSIKRVEILGAMQDEVGNLPDLDPDELSDLRTLQQVVDYLQEKLSGGGSSSTASAASEAPAASAVQNTPAMNGAHVSNTQTNGAATPEPALSLDIDVPVNNASSVNAQSNEMQQADSATVADTSTAIVTKSVPAAQSSAPASTSDEPALSPEKIAELTPLMLNVVADKTGYPADMLEMSMDMEADLGIDSIKRVEILGAMQDEVGNLPDLDPDELSELRTLQQVVDYLKDKLSGGGSTANAASETSAAPALEPTLSLQADEPTNTASSNTQSNELEQAAAMIVGDTSTATAMKSVPAEQSSASAADSPSDEAILSPEKIAELTPLMLNVVADKTGYPADMLEMSMDMEADLGIDSIKRVEILGAMQDEVGNLPDLDPDELSELRTLQQVVDYLKDKLSGGGSTVNTASETSATSEPTLTLQAEEPDNAASSNTQSNELEQAAAMIVGDTSTATATKSAPAEQSSAPAADSPSDETALSPEKIAELTPLMLNVVADKTGYPADMLEMSMDMEADLGIDSIKRVEILGAMQDEVGNLPDLDPDELSELRTLQQVVDYLKDKLSGGGSSSASDASSETPAMQNMASSAEMNVAATPEPALSLEVEEEPASNASNASTQNSDMQQAASMVVEDAAPLNDTNSTAVAQNASSSSTSDEPALSPEKIAELTPLMLNVVADKTGYPADMLEMSMDMEADLGIDSIKRVEILGAMQDEVGNLPDLDPDELSELRTLQQVVDYLKDKLSGGGSTANAASETSAASEPTLSLQAEEPDNAASSNKQSNELEQAAAMIVGDTSSATATKSVPAEQSSAPAADSPSDEAILSPEKIAELTPLMLNVVADKTGYPADMLEMSMDMEADLGIDSIKRVEILGAMQDEVGNLPDLDPDELSELRTLQQVVDYLKDKLSGGGAATASAQTISLDNSDDSITVTEFVDSPQGAQQDATQIDLSAAPVAHFTPVVEPVSEEAPSLSVFLQTLAAVKTIGEDQIAQGHVLLVDDGSELAPECCNQLLSQGVGVSVLQWPQQFVASSNNFPVEVLTLRDWDEASIQSQLQSLLASHEFSSLLLLQTDTSRLSSELKEQFVQASFMLSKYVQPALKASAEKSKRAAFMTVSRLDGCLGYASVVIGDVTQAALLGLTKTAKQEWSNIYCRAVDIAPEMAASTAAQHILQELFDSNTDLPEVAHGNKGRVCLQITQRNSYDLPIGSSINERSVFLVSGGAKGVTKNCVLRLAKQHHCRFVLLGRSAIEALPAWSQGIDDEPGLKRAAMEAIKATGEKPLPMTINAMVNKVNSTREIEGALAQIQNVGAQAEYISVDVTDASALQAAIAPAVNKLGAVTGIIHGAGVLADKLILQKSAAEIARVYQTKVKGLDALLSCVDPSQLKHLALFSSAAGFYGNIGQSDYSAANEVLNKRALDFKRAYPQCHVLSFNWGPWDGGMVSPALKKMFAERGVYVIPVDAGAQLFVNELVTEHNDAVQLLIGTAMTGAEDGAGKKNF